MNVYLVLTQLGVPSVNVPIAAQFLYLLPQTSDPDTAGVLLLVKAIQTGLRKLGHRQVQVSGVFDEQTARAIDALSPPAGSWRLKTWVQILDVVTDALKNPVATSIRAKALSGYHAQGDLLDDLSVIGPAAQFLKWGFGISSPSNCAPADDPTRRVFLAVQRQINRLGGGIVEDGILGTNTVKALQRFASITGVSPAGCADVANNAILIGVRLKAEADRQGIPTEAAKASAPPSTKVGGQVFQSKEALTKDTEKQLGADQGKSSLTQYLPYAFIAAGAAWFVLRRKKRA